MTINSLSKTGKADSFCLGFLSFWKDNWLGCGHLMDHALETLPTDQINLTVKDYFVDIPWQISLGSIDDKLSGFVSQSSSQSEKLIRVGSTKR